MRTATTLLAVPLTLTLLVGCSPSTPDGVPAPDPAAAPTTAAPTTAAPTTAAPTTDDTSETTAPPDGSTGTQDADTDPVLAEFGVSAGHPLAAQAGLAILEQGGSAVDAAIAAAFADAVVHPASSGIGGGGASIVLVDGEATSYDYRETVNSTGTVPADGIGTPGMVAGMHRLHQDHGRLPWADLLAPAITLASDGAPVSRFLAGSLAMAPGEELTEPLDQFRGDRGDPLEEGDLLVQTELADTMRVLAQEGPQALYTGSLADGLTDLPGIDPDDLGSYQVQVAEPAGGTVGEHTLLSAAPALPGAALVQLAQIAEAAGIGAVDPDSAEFVDLQSRAWQVAEETISTELGDPAAVDVPVERITDPGANAELAVEALAAGVPDGGADGGEGPGNTTHISVVDGEGTAVSMTHTITDFWGSGEYLDGYFVNNHLTRFDSMGTSGPNTPAPGRRPVTWSAPSMVVDDEGRPVLVLGTPGGPQIPNVVVSVVLRWTLHGQSLQQAVDADRFILTGGELRLEGPDLEDDLTDLGYDVTALPPAFRETFGSVQALEVDWEQGRVTGHADDRRAAGYEVGSTEGSR